MKIACPFTRLTGAMSSTTLAVIWAAVFAILAAAALEALKPGPPTADQTVVKGVEEAYRLFRLGLLPSQREAELTQLFHGIKDQPFLTADLQYISEDYDVSQDYDPTPPNSTHGALAVVREARRLFELGASLAVRKRDVNAVNDEYGKPFKKELIDFLCEHCGFGR